jgi:hypothetical protein
MTLHVIRHAGPPTNPPPAVGAHWFDTLNKQEYISFDTALLADWVLQNTSVDIRVKNSATDTTPGYLLEKSQAGTGISFTTINPAGNEKTEIANTDTGSAAVSGHNLAFTHSDIALNTTARHAAVTLGTANGLGLSGQQLSLQAATSLVPGALTAADWTLFNGKEAGGTMAAHLLAYAHGDIAHTNRAALDLVSGTNTGDETQSTIKTKLGAATTSVDGYLTSTDWATFNGKQANIGAPASLIGDTGKFLEATGATTSAWSKMRYNAGTLTVPVVTDNGSGLIDVGAFTVRFNTAADFTGVFVDMAAPALTGLQLVANTYTYVVADYNGGTPTVYATTNNDIVNHSTIINVTQFYWENLGAVNETHILSTGQYGLGLTNKIGHRLIHTERFGYESGLTLTEYGTRNIAIADGHIWYDGEEISTLSVATATAGQETHFYYHAAGVWALSTATQYNNSQYDNGTDLVSLSGSSRYAVNWLYKCANGSDRCSFMLLGGGNYTLSAAQNTQAPASIPDVVRKQAILVGRIIVKNGDPTATQIDSAFNVYFANGTSGAADGEGSVQFNIGGALTGDAANFFWDNTNKRLQLGPVSALAKLHVSSAAVGNIGQIIQGFSGQTANLQQWQNSSGTVLAAVSSAGEIYSSSVNVFSVYGARYGKLTYDDPAGSYRFGRSDHTNTCGVIVNPTTAVIVADGLVLRSNGTLILTGFEGGGQSTIDLNRRYFDSSAGVGGTVNCWTFTGQTTNAFQVLAPGGASATATICPLGCATFTGLKLGIRTVTSSPTLTAADHTVKCDCTSGAQTVTLPTGAGETGRILVFKKVDTSANAVTIGTVDGATLAISTTNVVVRIQYDGTVWSEI